MPACLENFKNLKSVLFMIVVVLVFLLYIRVSMDIITAPPKKNHIVPMATMALAMLLSLPGTMP